MHGEQNALAHIFFHAITPLIVDKKAPQTFGRNIGGNSGRINAFARETQRLFI